MPQHAKRVKVRRKDLRKPDEFETLTGQALAWAEDHRSLVTGIAAAALIVAAVSLGVGRWRASRNESAGSEFRTAYARFTDQKFDAAAREFAEVTSNYPGTPFGRLAGLYRAHALARQGDAAAAATAYADYLAGSPPAEYLRQEALIGLAGAKEASGDTAGALDAYTQAGALPGPFRNDALLAEARLHEAAGEAAKASAIYVALLKEAPAPELQAFLASKVPPAARPSAAAGGATADVETE